MRVQLFTVLLLAASVGHLRAEEPLILRESFPAGYQYHVSTRVELDGQLNLPPAKQDSSSRSLKVTGHSAIEYDERVLAPDADNTVRKTARIYRRIDFERTVGNQVQQNTIRPAVRRLIVLRRQQVEVPFSPDGPLLWGEIDLVRTDVFTPALVGLLPERPARVGDRWMASTAAIQELTDMERIEDGRVECRLEQVALLERRRHARIAFEGTVRGINEDGPNRQQVTGYLFFDLESPHISYLYLNGVSFLLDKEGKTQGKVEGRFVLTRQAPHASADLDDSAIRGLAVEPTEDNTLLLYENPDLGVRLLHSRRWRIGGARGRQIGLDEANGNGVLLTAEALADVPGGQQYLNEARSWLEQQKAKILRIEPPRPLGAGLESFAIDMELNGQKVTMLYLVVRQAQAGATLAARLLTSDRAALQPDVVRLARSLVLTLPANSSSRK
jgi:hypothetical protein